MGDQIGHGLGIGLESGASRGAPLNHLADQSWPVAAALADPLGGSDPQAPWPGECRGQPAQFLNPDRPAPFSVEPASSASDGYRDRLRLPAAQPGRESRRPGASSTRAMNQSLTRLQPLAWGRRKLASHKCFTPTQQAWPQP